MIYIGNSEDAKRHLDQLHVLCTERKHIEKKICNPSIKSPLLLYSLNEEEQEIFNEFVLSNINRNIEERIEKLKELGIDVTQEEKS